MGNNIKKEYPILKSYLERSKSDLKVHTWVKSLEFFNMDISNSIWLKYSFFSHNALSSSIVSKPSDISFFFHCLSVSGSQHFLKFLMLTHTTSYVKASVKRPHSLGLDVRFSGRKVRSILNFYKPLNPRIASPLNSHIRTLWDMRTQPRSILSLRVQSRYYCKAKADADGMYLR